MYQEDNEKALNLADEIIKNTYRTLLTRGQKGCYIYCEDKLLSEYLKRRVNRCNEIIDKVHNIISFERLYEITGSQFQSFNTIYQLYHDKINNRLDNATDFLYIPEYLMYKLMI